MNPDVWSTDVPEEPLLNDPWPGGRPEPNVEGVARAQALLSALMGDADETRDITRLTFEDDLTYHIDHYAEASARAWHEHVRAHNAALALGQVLRHHRKAQETEAR